MAEWTLNRRFWEFEHIDPAFAVDWGVLRERVARRESFRNFKLKLRNGEEVAYYELAGQPVLERGEFVGYRGLAWDVTERESLIARITESEARFRALSELSSDWYWEMDEALRFTLLRQGARGSFSLDDEDVIGKHRWELPGELIQPSSWDEHRATLMARRPFRDVMFRRWMPDGSLVYHLTSGDPVFDADGQFRGYRGIGKNITDQIRAQERIERLATVDALTQLSNRQTFDERAGRVLATSYAEGKRCALLFIDLDNFRLLNNGYGHRVGDEMLAIVASRMREVVGEPHLLGRRGGDELVALLVDLQRPDAAVEAARKLIDSIAVPARILGMEISVTASVGISFFPQDGIDLDSLLNAADAAMYQAKDSGRRTYAFYTQTVARRVDLRLRLEQRLRKAVESRDFKLFFQPLVSLADGKMVGAEALIRWRDAELGDISPAEFIPIAEESGLIVGLGDWVLREACRVRQEWRHLQLDIPPVSINMSGVQLRQLGCVEGLLDVLSAYDVPASDIEVEVTETGLLDTSAVSRENLVRMRNAGVQARARRLRRRLLEPGAPARPADPSPQDRPQLHGRVHARRPHADDRQGGHRDGALARHQCHGGGHRDPGAADLDAAPGLRRGAGVSLRAADAVRRLHQALHRSPWHRSRALPHALDLGDDPVHHLLRRRLAGRQRAADRRDGPQRLARVLGLRRRALDPSHGAGPAGPLRTHL